MGVITWRIAARAKISSRVLYDDYMQMVSETGLGFSCQRKSLKNLQKIQH